jgi:hypothetical protein
VTDPTAFVRWVATFGPMARIESPPELVAAIVALLEATVERCSS